MTWGWVKNSDSSPQVSSLVGTFQGVWVARDVWIRHRSEPLGWLTDGSLFRTSMAWAFCDFFIVA